SPSGDPQLALNCFDLLIDIHHVLQFLKLRKRFSQKSLMRSGLRMKRPMGECGADAFPLIEESARLFIEVSGYKMIPYVIFRFFSRMDHIAFVETVVAQVIHHDLEGGIIFYIGMRLHDGTTGRAQYGLAETVPFDCVAEMTHGTNGKNYCTRRIEGPQPVVEIVERFHDVIAAKK